MALKPMKPTKHPGVYQRKDGIFVVRVTARTSFGKPIGHVKTLDPRTTEEEAVRTASMMREQLRQEVALLEMGATPSHRQQDTNLVPSLKIEDYARQWYRQKSHRLKPGTRKRYAEVLDKRILPRIGHLYVANVCRAMVESWATWVEGLLKSDGEPYADDTLKGWWKPFKEMMQDMAADFGFQTPPPGYVPLNPV